MDSDRDAIFAALQDEIAAERGARAWLRARPTWQRLSVALGVAALLPLAVVILWARADLGIYPIGRLVFEAGVLGLTAALALALALRPLHRPPLSPWLRRGLLVLAVVAAAVIAGLPAAHDDPGSQLGGAFARHAIGCFSMGLLWALPVILVVRAVDRAPLLGGTAVLAGGLIGDLTLGFHCPIVTPAHLLAGHFTVVVLAALLTMVLVWRRRAA